MSRYIDSIPYHAQYQGEWDVKKPIIVLAGNYWQYRLYLREHGATGSQDKRFVYGDLRVAGIEASVVVVTGNFWDRKDANAIYDLARTRVR